jgi:hypothetical protein
MYRGQGRFHRNDAMDAKVARKESQEDFFSSLATFALLAPWR